MHRGSSLFEKELAEDGRILSSLSWLRQSGFTTRVADERMEIYAANGAICAYCYSADEVVAFARRQSPVRGAGMAVPAGIETSAHAIRIRDLEETIRYLELTGRPQEQVDLVAAYAKAQGLWRINGAPAASYTDVLELDANYVRRSDAEIFWKGPASGVR